MTNDREPFGVLVLCTANRCRSPLAEFLLRDQSSRLGLDWNVSSAGIRAEPGLPPDPRIERMIGKAGLSTSGWSTRAFDPRDVEAADLVLTATRAHRLWVVTQAPSALNKTMPLAQFAELCAGVQQQELPEKPSGHDLLEATRRVRARSQPRDGNDWDIPDPIGRSPWAFSRCRTQVQHVVAQIVRPMRDKSFPGTAKGHTGW